MRRSVRAQLVDTPSVRYVCAAAPIPVVSVAEEPETDIENADGEYNVAVSLPGEKQPEMSYKRPKKLSERRSLHPL